MAKTALGTITNLTATAGIERVTLNWTAAAGATSQQPRYATAPGGPWTNFGAALSGTATTVDVTGLVGGTLYYFTVTATDGATTTTSNEVSATPAKATPKAETLSDNFNDNSRDVAKWELIIIGTLATIAEVNQRLEVTPPVGSGDRHEAHYRSVNKYDLTGSHFYMEVLQAMTGGSVGTEFRLYQDNGADFYRWTVQGNLYAQYQAGGTYTTFVNLAYDPVAHRWWRFRHDAAANLLHFETSPDNVTWTSQGSHAPSASLTLTSGPITSLRPQIGIESFGVNGSPGMAIYDNFNTAGGEVLKRSRLETLNLNEARRRTLNRFRSRLETVNASEAPRRTLNRFRSRLESVQVSEVPIRVRNLIRTRLESLNLSELTARALGRSRSILEGVRLSEIPRTTFVRVRARLESLRVTEASRRTLVRLRVRTEGLNVAEARSRGLVFIRSRLESMQVATFTRNLFIRVRTHRESVQLGESRFKIRGLIRAVLESVRLAETRQKLQTLVRRATEGLQIAGVQRRSITLFRSLAEGLSLSERREFSFQKIRVIAEQIRLAEVRIRNKVLVRGVLEAFRIAEGSFRKVSGLVGRQFVGTAVQYGSRVARFVGGAVVNRGAHSVKTEDGFKSTVE